MTEKYLLYFSGRFSVERQNELKETIHQSPFPWPGLHGDNLQDAGRLNSINGMPSNYLL